MNVDTSEANVRKQADYMRTQGYAEDDIADLLLALLKERDEAMQKAKTPDEWKLVPLGTTWDMRNECRELLINFGVKAERLDALAVAIWQSMTDAAPKAPLSKSGDSDA